MEQKNCLVPGMPPAIRAVIFVGLPWAGQESLLQELVWAGVQVAVISPKSGAESGSSYLGRRSVPVGCVQIAGQASNVPAALRAAAGKLGILLCQALVHLPQDWDCPGFGLDNLPDIYVLHGSRTIDQVAAIVADSHRLDGCAMVGVVMKDARWRDFLQRGFFPATAQHRLCFKRMTACQALVDTASYDLLVAKPTDELLRLDDNGSPVFTADMGRLIASRADRMLDCPGDMCQIVNREAMSAVLEEVAADLQDRQLDCAVPLSCKVTSRGFGPETRQQLSQAGIAAPIVLKPQAACGVDGAHDMALVTSIEGLPDNFQPAVPAIAQQFVNHGGVLHKVSVIGSKVHCASRRSVADMSPASGTGSLLPFNSQDLPFLDACQQQLPSPDIPPPGASPLSPDFVHAAAQSLGTRLKSTLFGFDVIVDRSTGKHILLDVNHFPSYKEVAEAKDELWIMCTQKIEALRRRENSSLSVVGAIA